MWNKIYTRKYSLNPSLILELVFNSMDGFGRGWIFKNVFGFKVKIFSKNRKSSSEWNIETYNCKQNEDI